MMATLRHLPISAGTVSLSRPADGLANRLAVFSLTAMITLSIVVPVITISGSLPWLKIEQLALPIVLLVYCWLVLTGFARPFRWNGLMTISLLFAGCIALSIFLGSVLFGHRIILADYYELPKAFLPVLFFTLGIETRFSEAALRRLLFWFSAAIVLVCLYAWAQWMDLGISHVLARFYSGGWHDEGSLAHYRRVYSTMGNPNILGQLLTWAFSGFVLAILFGFGSRLRNLLMTGACLVTLVMTGSRYAVISVGIALLLIVFLAWNSSRIKRSVLVAFLVSLPVLAWIGLSVASSNRATLDRVQTLSNPLATDSFRARQESLWRDATHEFLQSPFFGHGPAKTIFGDIITDSEYLDVLKKFGLFGFVVYLGYFFFPLRILARGLRESGSRGDFQAPAALWNIRFAFIMVVLALFMNIGMSTFYSAPLQGFLWMWLGIAAGSAREHSVSRRGRPATQAA